MSEEVQPVAAETAPELEVTATPEIVEDKPVKTFTEDEVNSIVTKRLAKEQRKLRREVELETENKFLKEQVGKRSEPPEPTAPKQEEFGSYEDFLEAKAEWIAEKKVDAKFEQRKQEEAQRKTEAERNEVVKTWQQKVETATTKYADFDAVLDSADHIEVPAPLQSAIMESALGAELAYHLAKNSAELERIVSLKPYAALMELGKLEVKLSQPPEPKKAPASKAPEPISPLGGKSTVTTGHSPNDDMATFIRKRNIEKGRIK